MVKVIEGSLVLVYFLIVIGIGWYFKDRRSEDEYWSAGGQIGTFVNTFAVFAAFSSGGTFLGAIGVAYAFGAPFIYAAAFSAALGFAAAAVLVAKPMRRVDRYTIADIFDFLYEDRRINTIVPIIAMIGAFIYVLAQLKGAGLAAEFILDIPYVPSVTAVGLVFVAYVALGGMWAITITDFLQGAIMWFIGFFTWVISLAHFGFDPSAPLREVPQVANMAPLPMESYLGFALIWFTTITVFPTMVMRVFSAESPQSAKRAFSWMAFLYWVFSFISMYIVAAAALSIAPDLSNPDFALIAVMEQLLGPILAGLTAAAILAAVMSTTDALLLVISSSIANDLYKNVINPDASEERVVRLGTISVVVLGLIAIVVSWSPPDLLVELLTDAAALWASAFFFPMVLGIWWKRMNSTGALLGIVSGAITYAALWFVLPVFVPIIYSLLVSLVFSVGGAYFTGSPAEERLRRLSEELGHTRVGW